VFARPADRHAIEQAAADAGVPFRGLWLEAPERILVERLQHRGADASDADVGVLRMQAAQGAGQITWQRLDASASAGVLLKNAAARVGASAVAA
jgi:predicted kinase